MTRLLQDSLGGKTKTSIIATISPASISIEESLSTLDYAYRAKNIQNRPEVNQKLTKKAILREYTEEIERLRKDLVAAREKNGVYVDKENYERMMSQIESQDQDLSEKIQLTKNMQDQILEKEKEIVAIKAILQETTDDLDSANSLIDEQRQKLSDLTKTIHSIQNEKEEMALLVEVHSETENKLQKEASTLLSTASDATSKLDTLFHKLERKKYG